MSSSSGAKVKPWKKGLTYQEYMCALKIYAEDRGLEHILDAANKPGAAPARLPVATYPAGGTLLIGRLLMAGYYRWYNCALVLEYRAQSDTSVSDQPPSKENESVTHISSLMKYQVLRGL